MNRRDFVLITAVFSTALEDEIRLAGDGPGAMGIRFVARRMADALSRNNPKFDRLMFFKNMGLIDHNPPKFSLGETLQDLHNSKPETQYVYVLCRTGSYQPWGQVRYSSQEHAQQVADHYNQTGEAGGQVWVKKVKV